MLAFVRCVPVEKKTQRDGLQEAEASPFMVPINNNTAHRNQKPRFQKETKDRNGKAHLKSPKLTKVSPLKSPKIAKITLARLKPKLPKLLCIPFNFLLIP